GAGIIAHISTIGSDFDDVERIALLVGNGVGADLFDLSLQAAVNGKVIRGELDLGRLIRVQEADIARMDTHFQQQRVVGRHNFQNILAWLHHSADRIGEKRLDGATYWRTDVGQL